MLAAILMLCGTAQAQGHKSHPVDVRMEIVELEDENNVNTRSFGIFTYMDADSTFGYYMSLGTAETFLEISGTFLPDIAIGSYEEACIWLGATADEALSMLDSLLALYDRDVETTVELRGRACPPSIKLGGEVTIACTVKKKPLFGGHRLQLLYPCDGRMGETYLSKWNLKQLRNGLKLDKKLHKNK